MKNLLAIILLFLGLNIAAQNQCPTTLNFSQLQLNDPARYQRFADLEAFTANCIANQANTGQRLINQNGVIVIPVVVHILHRGEAIGNGRNLSFAQIQSQIDVLNEDFRRTNADAINTPAPFAAVAADYGFEFRLACQDPNGNPTDGIIRIQTNRDNFQFVLGANDLPNENAMGIKITANGGSNPWPTDRYLNVWVADFNDGLLGYGTWPADFATRPQFDGIVVETTAFGRVGNVAAPFDRGRIATHEVGHWLNLRHVWGDDNCGDDFVGDTPPQSNPTSGCPGFPNASGCNVGNANGRMFMNYMDYTNSGCMNLFTNGQRLRGRAVFAAGGPRAAFADNYFQIIPPAAGAIRCRESVRLFNPTCSAPVTWSVVSGPATIAGGQNTNEALIQSSGTGQAIIRATVGNFITELPVNVNQTAAPIAANSQQINCTDLSINVNNQHFNNYQWTVQSGDILLNGSSLSTTTTTPSILATGTFGTISVIATNACGSSASTFIGYQQQFPPSLKEIENYIPYPEPSCYQVEGFYFFKATDFGTVPLEYQWGYRFNGGSDIIVAGNGPIQQYIFSTAGSYEIFVRPRNECITGNQIVKQIVVQSDCMGGWQLRSSVDTSDYLVYPNPATDRINVSVKSATNNNKIHSSRENGITSITIYDKQGAVRKRLTYPPKTKNVLIDVSTLPVDIYILEIKNGVTRFQKTISIKR